jgi:hypothetical protein
VADCLHYAQFIKMFADAGQQSGDLTLHSFLLSITLLLMNAGRL